MSLLVTIKSTMSNNIRTDEKVYHQIFINDSHKVSMKVSKCCSMHLMRKFPFFFYIFPVLFIVISCQEDNIVFYKEYGEVSYGNHLRFNTHKPQLKSFFFFSGWNDSQDAAIYKNFLLNVRACDEIDDNVENAYLWDLNTGIKIATLILGYSMNGKNYYKPHANTVCFGNEILDDSPFPLLYVSQTFGLEYGKINSKDSGVLVYKLVSNDDKYKAELVQVIKPATDDIVLFDLIGCSIHNYVVDYDSSKLYVLGYDSDNFYNADSKICISSFNLPKSSDGQEIVLTSHSIVDSYTLPMSYCMQSVFYDAGFLYIMNGDCFKYKWLRSLNLYKKKIESVFDFTDLSGEPQFCGYWNGKLLMYFSGSQGLLFEITD